MKLILDFPVPELNPNKRIHWAKKARAVKWYRNHAWRVALKEPGRNQWDRAEIRAVFCVPDARRRDPDNLMACMKAAWDGFVDAQILSDDRGLVLYPPTLVIDRKRPRVEIEITEAA